HRQHDKALSDRGGIQGQRELLAVPAFYHPGQPRCPAGAEIELAAPGSRLGRRFAVQIAKPLAQGIELLLQARRQRQTHGGQRARPSHDHAEAPQSQARGHRLAQMGKPLGDDIVPLVKSREAGHGSSPVSGNACHTSAYQNRASPFCCPEPRNLHLKGVRPSVGTTPRPSREERGQLRKYAGPLTDPMRTLDLRARRPRLWQLKEAPFRIQVGDEMILGYTFLGNTGREFSLQGRMPGTTVLNLWFGDRLDGTRQTV